MNHRFIKLLLLLIISVSALQSLADENQVTSPNFIVIVLDDFGWSSLSISMDNRFPNAKSDYYETPNINKILNRGIRFSNGYASSPVCSPTRYSIQFGKDPASLGRTRGLGPNRVDHDQVGIAQVLKAVNKNYQTAHFGKWHIDADPSQYGYDYHDGQTGNKEGGFDNSKNNRQWVGYASKDPKLVNQLTSRTVEFIRTSVAEKKPFFVQLSHYAVHSDIVYSENSFDRLSGQKKGVVHQDQGFAAMVYDLDKSIGGLLDVYDELNLNDNTYLMLVSDNGGMPVLPQQVNLGRPYKMGLNYPLLRGKWDLLEGGIRIPFAAMGPGVESNTQSDVPVITHDILPTIADLANAYDLKPDGINGVSIKKLFFNPKSQLHREPNFLIFHYPHYNRVGINEPHSAIREDEYKLIKFPISNRHLLFKITEDIGEERDLSNIFPDIVAKLDRKLSGFLESVNAEKPEDAYNWETVGKQGKERTKFFKRYDN